MEFEPKIIAFCCNWCSYAAADLAGSLRMSYPSNIKIIRVPCSGRVDPLLILTALQLGVDGVFVAGCKKGECHYVDGNYRAEERVNFLKKVLEKLKLEPERVEMFFISASEPDVFSESAKKFTEKIKELGPNPLRDRLKEYKVAYREDKKRRIIAQIIRGIATALDIEPASLGEIEAIDTYSQITIDEKKCDGCRACESVCEYDAINFEETDGKLKFKYNVENCILCGICIENCPKDAISIKNILNLQALASAIPITQAILQMRKCELCGKYFVPEKMVESLTGKTVVPEALKYCPNCRVYISAKKLLTVLTRRF